MKKLFLMLAVLVPIGAWAQAAQLEAGANKTATVLSTNVFVVRTAQCKMYSVSGHNMTGGDVWIQLHDTNAVPSEGAIPVYHPVLVPDGKNFSIDETAGYNFRTGLIVTVSTTPVSYTNGSAGVHFKATYYDRAF